MGARDRFIGRSIAGKFVLESLIGKGAMGSVYRARHVALDAVVAVKLMHEEMAKDATFAERFHREARAASRLDHANVIRVIDFGTEPEGLLYIVMDYVDGRDLGQLIERQFPLSEDRIVDLLSQMLSAISAAHSVGVIHRDLKPENVLVTTRMDDEGNAHELVKVCDFGIAQMSEPAQPDSAPGSRPLTMTGVLLGTPQYMSPEQCRGEALDARADLYAVGVMLYELLTGNLPFVAENPIDVVVKHVSIDPVPPGKLHPEVSPELERVCMKALAKRREDRYGSAREMRVALRSAIGAADPEAGMATPRLVRAPAGATLTPPISQPSRVKEPAKSTRLALERSAAGAKTPGRRWGYRAAIVAILGAGLVVVSSRTDRASFEAKEPPRPASSGGSLPPNEGSPPPAEQRDLTLTAEPSEAAKAEDTHVATANVGERSTVRAARTPRRSASSGGTESAAESALKTSPADTRRPESPPSEAIAAAASPQPFPAPKTAEAAGATNAAAPASNPHSVASTAPRPAPDPARGRVNWGVSAVGGGATVGGVSRALARASGAWTTCYRTGLKARSSALTSQWEGSATLRLVCDDQGRVVEARVSGLAMPDVASCLERSVMGATIPNADTGEAWSTIALTFKIDE